MSHVKMNTDEGDMPTTGTIIFVPCYIISGACFLLHSIIDHSISHSVSPSILRSTLHTWDRPYGFEQLFFLLQPLFEEVGHLNFPAGFLYS